MYGGLDEVRARIAALGTLTFGSGERVSAILAGIHPIEWIGVEVALELCERLARDPPRDRRVIAFPLINEAGFAKVDVDRRAGRRRYHRFNPAGVDLNRNFPVHFRPRRRHGRARGDQPEVRAVVRALSPLPIDRAVSLHSIGKKILLPYGGQFRRPARWRELHAAALGVQAKLPDYEVVQASHWLPGAFAYGLELDWLHGDLGALAMLVECSMGGFSLTRPSTWIDPFSWYNPPDAAHHVARIADALEPFVRGQS